MILTYLLQEDDCRIEPGSSFLKGSTRHPALAQPRRPPIPTSQPPDGILAGNDRCLVGFVFCGE